MSLPPTARPPPAAFPLSKPWFWRGWRAPPPTTQIRSNQIKSVCLNRIQNRLVAFVCRQLLVLVLVSVLVLALVLRLVLVLILILVLVLVLVLVLILVLEYYY